MGAGHNHAHATDNLKLALFLNLGFTLFEFAGGYWVNSVAILSDALHDLGDSVSLALAWYLGRKATQGPTERFSFGYSRFSLLGAFINSVVLIAGTTFVISEAVQRIQHPEPSNAPGMVAFALIGVAVNGYAAWRMRSSNTMNERVISLHLLEDVLGWAAVLVVAITLLFIDLPILDPALSLVISAWVGYNAIRRLMETGRLFLQGVPDGLQVKDIEDKIVAVPNVQAIHHTHLWSLDSEKHVFTTHVELKGISTFAELMEVKDKVRGILSEYPFSHYTIETELDEETCPLAHGHHDHKEHDGGDAH